MMPAFCCPIKFNCQCFNVTQRLLILKPPNILNNKPNPMEYTAHIEIPQKSNQYLKNNICCTFSIFIYTHLYLYNNNKNADSSKFLLLYIRSQKKSKCINVIIWKKIILVVIIRYRKATSTPIFQINLYMCFGTSHFYMFYSMAVKKAIYKHVRLSCILSGE